MVSLFESVLLKMLREKSKIKQNKTYKLLPNKTPSQPPQFLINSFIPGIYDSILWSNFLVLSFVFL